MWPDSCSFNVRDCVQFGTQLSFSCTLSVCRDLGLVQEAEELLSDICGFYSEDRWAQLSTKAYSLLADCQYKLKMEDKYLYTQPQVEAN